MSGTPSQLAPVARLFGRLLVRELDADSLAELSQPDVRRALAALGVDVPTDDATLPTLAAEWCEHFLHPAGVSPPVHSLFRDGHYNGDPAVAVGRIAGAAGLQQAPGARNAPPDHIGCILLLWAELAGPRPELAHLLASEHMQWAERALHPLATSAPSFYQATALATVDLLAQIRGSSRAPASPPSIHSQAPPSNPNQGTLS